MSASLNEDDRKHVHRILNDSIALDKAGLTEHSRVAEFVRDEVYISSTSVDAFKALDQTERERILSDLIWRITCHLDGSVTRVRDARKHSLGKRFVLRSAEVDGKTAFCVMMKK